MPEQSELFAVNRKHLVGKLVTATVSNGVIAGIELPEGGASSDLVVIGAKDFGECNFIDVMGEIVPIFAKDEVSYKGQPVLAVFGTVSEDVELFCNAVKVSYQITPDSESSAPQVFGEPFNWSYGNTDEYFVQGSKTLKTTFSVGSHSCNMLGDQKIFAVMDEGVVKLQMETQWPVHVRRSVANVLGLPFEDVHIDVQPYFASFDQLIMMPSLLSCIAAKAASMTGELVRLYAPLVSWQPKMDFEFRTAVLQDGGCAAGRYKCTIDMGAFPIFSKEVCYNILAGIVPVYPMKALDVTVTIMKSCTPPANFFGDLGYSMSLAAVENHFTQLALAYGQQPGLWKLEQVKECGHKGTPMSECVRESSGFDNLAKTLDDVVSSSWYSRKYAANAQKALFTERMNPLVNYSRGIGIATGEGIMGFSQQYNALVRYSLSVTLTQDERVVVNTGMQAGKNMMAVWKQAIRQFLDVDEDSIVFKSVNDADIIDIGPDVLSRRIGIVTRLLIKACSEISKKKAFSRLPITVTAYSEADLSDPYYFSSCFGTVAVELHLDTVSLSPVIDKVWARFHMGHVFDVQKLVNKARLSIFSVISEVLPNWSGDLNIDLEVSQDSDYTPSSVTAAVRGLTMAALISAVSQAIGRYVNAVPITESSILALLKGSSSNRSSVAVSDKAKDSKESVLDNAKESKGLVDSGDTMAREDKEGEQ